MSFTKAVQEDGDGLAAEDNVGVTDENLSDFSKSAENLSPEKTSDDDTSPTVAAQKNPRPDNCQGLFTFNLNVDFVQCLLFLVALVTRTWQLGLPRAVVFDELHFGKFVSLYMRKIFFFDYNPPLGKMMLATGGSFMGFEGDTNFDRIGAEYSPEMPVYQTRLIPAVFGSLLVPMVYQIISELGLSQWVALLAGSMVLFDNALLTQSRFMLLEPMLLFCMSLSLLSFIKFRKLSHSDKSFSPKWWFWLLMIGLSFSCALSIKYVGCSTAILILYLVMKDFWKMLADKTQTDASLLRHMLARGLMLISVPITVYLLIFYVHLSILTRAGPHDNIMTSAFQASLEGGLAAITKGQPLQVSYGSQITLRHTHGRPCWLHSHSHLYPIRYHDSRGSSHQQQVTCYSFKDIHNWWIIKHPSKNTLTMEGTPRPVHHGDTIQLIHGITRRALNSHDVAAPVSPQCQEVSCYIDYNVSMTAQYLWKVDIVNRQDDSETWQTIKSTVRLIHANTSFALKVSWKQLPEWGFHQLEVVTDKHVNQQDTVWNVEEHRYTTPTDSDDPTKELAKGDLIPLTPTHLSFLEKFWELQVKMFSPVVKDPDAISEHKYSSTPLEWPFMTRNIAYWLNPQTNAQIHLLGNPLVWYTVAISVLWYLSLLAFYLLRRRRACYDIPQSEWEHYIFIGELFIGGYFLHYLPFFLTDRTLFLYNYLPALLYGILAVAALVDHVFVVVERFPVIKRSLQVAMVILFSLLVWAFIELSVISYGTTPLTNDDAKRLQWRQSWEFIVQRQV